jgi:hypothetical protein
MQQINLFLSNLKVLNWPFSCYATVYSPFLGCKMIKFGQFDFIKNWFLMFLLNDMKFIFFIKGILLFQLRRYCCQTTSIANVSGEGPRNWLGMLCLKWWFQCYCVSNTHAPLIINRGRVINCFVNFGNIVRTW